ncbi:transcription termination factor MTEF18, mitochondrial-like [Cucurbita maxima]|uniref:Transcription termination factor MTEF18, mitochondrial-like n=1 Tax=Cucurbita maxima TaxID=3661 RepID=A0A6J1HWI4_CUCMA|nr:transcription termination factor MTEF18, mitochondrial-like [Cucurbita maxima]
MSYLQKLTKISVVSSSIIADNNFNSFRFMYWIIGSSPVASNPRFYRTKKPPQTGECGNSGGISTRGSRNGNRISRATRKEAQFMDAENMSRNSPIFLEKLLGRVEHESDTGRSITRFLLYHPINEFEPFFENAGLQPAEYNAFLPCDLMFSSDDSLLLENYNVLCSYGIERNKIGKIYKEATQILVSAKLV